MLASVIFGTANSIVKIGEYLKIVDSINSKIDRVIGMHLKAAQISLESALNSSDTSTVNMYIERAMVKFIDAISVETDTVNRIHSYFGLAFCNSLLNDRSNFDKNVKELKSEYNGLLNELPDSVSILQQMSEEGSGEGGTMEKTIISVVSLGAIPIISGIVEVIKEPIRNRAKKRINSVSAIMQEIDRI